MRDIAKLMMKELSARIQDHMGITLKVSVMFTTIWQKKGTMKNMGQDRFAV